MTTTIKIHIKTVCKYCDGKAYFPVGPATSYNGEIYTMYKPCGYCDGTGLMEKWISLSELVELIEKADPLEVNYQSLAETEPVSQYQDNRDSAGI